MGELLGGVLSAVFSGGATGLLGVLLQRFFDFKQKSADLEVLKETNRCAEALAALENQRVERTAQAQEHQADQDRIGRIGQAAEERAAAEAVTAGKVQQASYEHDRVKFLTGSLIKSGNKFAIAVAAGVDVLRQVIRPGLTAYLVVMTHWMYQDMQALLQAQGSQLELSVVKELLVMIMQTVLYLCTTSVVWWFGTRPSQTGPARK